MLPKQPTIFHCLDKLNCVDYFAQTVVTHVNYTHIAGWVVLTEGRKEPGDPS